MGLGIKIELEPKIVEVIDKLMPFLGDSREEVIEHIIKNWLLDKYGMNKLREMAGLQPMIKE